MNYMRVAETLAQSSTCGRNHVGCVMVKDQQILVSAVNGVVAGDVSCQDLGGCIRERLHIKSGTEAGLCYAVCAETRCVCEAARDGIALKGAVVYCTHRPCVVCMKNLAVVGIKEVHYKYGYPDENSAVIARAAGMEVIQDV